MNRYEPATKIICTSLFLSSTFIAGLLVSPTVLSQTPDAGSILLQQEQLQPSFPQQLPNGDADETVKPAMKADSGVKVRVKAIHFTGATDLVPNAELTIIIAPALDQSLDFNTLQALTEKVTQHLRQSGWLLARAYLPKQDVTEGIIEIAILKGRLDGSQSEGGGWTMNLSENSRIHAETLINIAEYWAPSGSSPKEKQLERALLLMNDLPGISARSRFAAGSQTGTTQITVDVNEGPLVTGNAWVNNFGNDATGTNQANAVVNVNDPLGYGEHASVYATKSKGLSLARIGFDVPLNSNGLNGSIAYTDMHYDVITGAGKTADLNGDARIVTSLISYPFIRSRLLNLYGDLSYNHKTIVDDSSSGKLTDKRINVFTLSLKGDGIDKWGGDGINSYSIAVTSGDLDLSGLASNQATDAATLNTDGHYNKLNLSLSRLQRLPSNFTLLGSFSSQVASNNLDSSEKFVLGGPTGVRAYPVSEGLGDEGWLGSAELRYDLPQQTPLGRLQLSSFVDTGHIRTHNTPGSVSIPTATGKNSYQLSGVGIGVNITESGSHSIKVGWAHTLGSNDGRSSLGKHSDGTTDKSRFWLQGIVWF